MNSERAPRLSSRPLNGRSRGARLVLRCFAMLLAILLPPSTATATPPNVIIDARFEEPTTRYNHAVLGAGAEWGALRLVVDHCIDCQTSDIRELLIRLPQDRVFEDLAPRIVDLDFDGSPEVVVIESHASFGARLAVYDDEGLITATPWIGTSFRWLAPLGAADLDDDGYIELAYIDRPHLAKTLRVWRFVDRELQHVASAPGLTNHRIGQAFISGGVRDCGNGPEIISADAKWRRIVSTRLISGALVSETIGAFENPASFRPILNCH